MTDHELKMMMLDIDGILTRYDATPTDVLTAAQAIATSAIGELINRDVPPAKAHPLADAIADQIRAALHKRIDEGKLPDW